jgi:HD superfamily phosphohydrolase YqeK
MGSILDEILSNEKSIASIKEENKKLEPILEEIELIKDENIKSFVRSILLRSEDFWKIPASFSGKWHPPDERAESGNVLHTKRVVRVAKVLSDSYSLSEDDRDIVYAACLLHDITKGVKYGNSNECAYDPMHPYTVAKFIKECQEYDKKYANEMQSSTILLSEEVVQSILRLIRCHLGPWSPVPETVPITYLDMIVHMSDNVASKLHNIIDGDNVIEERWVIKNG